MKLTFSRADRQNLFRMWVQGWRIIGKTILATFIITFFQALLGVPGWFISKLPPLSDGFRFVLALFILLIYMPLSFYVAASAVGFCPRSGNP